MAILSESNKSRVQPNNTGTEPKIIRGTECSLGMKNNFVAQKCISMSTKIYSPFSLSLNILLVSKWGSCVAVVSIVLPRFANAWIKVAPIWASHELPICPASRGKAVWANAVWAPFIQVSDEVVDEDRSAILAHKVRLRFASVWAPRHPTIGAAHCSVLFRSIVSLAFALKQICSNNETPNKTPNLT